MDSKICMDTFENINKIRELIGLPDFHWYTLPLPGNNLDLFMQDLALAIAEMLVKLRNVTITPDEPTTTSEILKLPVLQFDKPTKNANLYTAVSASKVGDPGIPFMVSHMGPGDHMISHLMGKTPSAYHHTIPVNGLFDDPKPCDVACERCKDDHYDDYFGNCPDFDGCDIAKKIRDWRTKQPQVALVHQGNDFMRVLKVNVDCDLKPGDPVAINADGKVEKIVLESLAVPEDQQESPADIALATLEKMRSTLREIDDANPKEILQAMRRMMQ